MDAVYWYPGMLYVREEEIGTVELILCGYMTLGENEVLQSR